METGQRIIRGKIFLDFNPWLLLAEDALAGAQILFRVLGPMNDAKLDPPHRATAFLFVRAFRAAHACYRLFAEGHEHESYILLRTVFEHMVDLTYLKENPGEVDNFWDYAAVGHHRYIETAAKYLPKPPFPKEYVERVAEQYERVKDRYPSELRWSRRNIADRAARIGLGEQYRFIYQMCSEYCHTGPITYPRHFVEGKNTIDVQLGPEVPDRPTAIALLITTLLQACELFDAVFDLGQARLLTSLAQEFRRLTGTEGV